MKSENPDDTKKIEAFMRKNFHTCAMIDALLKMPVPGYVLERRAFELFDDLEGALLSEFREQPDLLDSGLQFLETLRSAYDAKKGGRCCSH